MTALGKFVLAVAVVAALLVGSVVGTVSGTCASVPTTARAGLFTGSGVDWGCEAPFDCLVAFCGCIAANSSNHDVQCLSGVFNVNATTASQLETCSATLATCTLNAALASPGVSNRSCRAWGQPLAQQYALAYTARAAGDTTLSNLTASCEVDFCGVAQGVSDVNVSRVCSFVNFSWPAPIPRGVMPQCVASQTSRSYYTDLPLSSCSDVATCVQTFCGCVNGTWNTTTKDCNVPDDVNVTSPACLTSAVSCLLSAALSAYVPAASPLSPNACVAWSVPFAEDYAAYYSASAAQRSSTLLYQSCNFTACNLAIGELGTTDFSTVCNLPTTVQPTFTAYNPCPYRCPDATCAFNLAGCACTANAAIRDVQVVTAPTISETADASKSLSLAAYANYSVASGNCSGFNFNPAASFRWTLFSVSGGVLTTVRDANSSTLTLSAGSLTGGTSYVLVLRITGLLASQTVTRTYNFTATVPAPTLAFRNGATARLGTSSSLTLAVTVTDFDKSVASYTWGCVATSGTCPTLTNQTNVTAVIPANSADGVYTITYTYRSSNVSISVTIVDGSLPVVSIYGSTKALNAVPLVYLSSQSIVIGSAVVYSSKNVTYAWTIGSNTTAIGTGATLTLNSSNLGALTTTSVANAVASTFTTNTVTLTVTAANGAYGSSSLSVVVLEPLTMTLTVANTAGGSSAASLSDTLLLTPVVTGLTTVPFAAVSTTALSFTDNVSGTLKSTGLTTTPSGSAFTATAPMLSSYLSASTTFTATLSLNGIPAASATATFALTAPADKSAAAASVLSNLESTTDPSALAQAAATLSALALSSGNSTVKAAAASGLVSSLSSVSVANLPADQAQNLMSSLATLLPALDATTLTAQASSLQTAMTSTLANADADTAKAVADAAAALPAKNAAATYVAVGAALMKNVEVGQNVVVSKPGLEVAATAASASSLAGASYGSGASCAPYAELADGFTLPGTSSTDVVSIALTKSAAAPYGTVAPSGSTLTMEVLVNGASFDVSGLTVPIKLTLACDAGTGGCQFNSAASPTWTASSDVTTSVVNGRTVCTTPHLTSFGTFGSSSASAVAVSVLVVVLAALVQLVLA